MLQTNLCISELDARIFHALTKEMQIFFSESNKNEFTIYCRRKSILLLGV